MGDKLRDQVVPFCPIFRGSHIWLVPKGVHDGVGRKSIGHETQFHEWPDAVGQQTVIDLIDVREIEDRLTLFIFVVDAYLIMKDGMEPDIPEAGNAFDRLQVLAVTLTQGQNGAAGAEHLFPKVWESAR